MKKTALILSGDGINCEQESSFAAKQAGFLTEIIHINDLIRNKTSLDDLKKYFSLLILPGGFSFGDHLTSGRVLALKIKYHLNWDLVDYTQNGGLVLGICNGFQALIRLGVFGKDLTITQNQSGRFINKWVHLKKTNSSCLFLKNLPYFHLPVRHGEGRIIFASAENTTPAGSIDFRVALTYETDINGSQQQTAGLTSRDGRIFGLMPHPEAAIRKTQNPYWTLNPDHKNEQEVGLEVFKNAYTEAMTCL